MFSENGYHSLGRLALIWSTITRAWAERNNQIPGYTWRLIMEIVTGWDKLNTRTRYPFPSGIGVGDCSSEYAIDSGAISKKGIPRIFFIRVSTIISFEWLSTHNYCWILIRGHFFPVETFNAFSKWGFFIQLMRDYTRGRNKFQYKSGFSRIALEPCFFSMPLELPLIGWKSRGFASNFAQIPSKGYDYGGWQRSPADPPSQSMSNKRFHSRIYFPSHVFCQ